MDAVTVQILAKLVGFGIALHKGQETEGITSEDLKALQSFLGTAANLLGRRRNDEQPLRALHLGLVVRSFGVAVGRHWAFNDQMVPGPSRLPHWAWKIWDAPKAKRYQELETRVRHAALKALEPGQNAKPGEELALLQSLTTTLPTNSPYYKALWIAFSDPGLDESEDDPPICLEHEGNAREFERYFRQAYAEALTTENGRRVDRWRKELLSESSATLRWSLMEDMAGWGRRHVLGNAAEPGERDALPFMPLDDIYVEPQGRLAGYRDSPTMPIKKLIRELLSKHHLVVVTADFGHGKSLTARTLAKERAQEWLSNNRESGTQLAVPVFVKCSRDIKGTTYKHTEVVRRALWNHAKEGLELDKAMSSEIFKPLELEQEALFILDGLDEVSLELNLVQELFERLEEEVRGHHRVVVFTRPGALGGRQCLPKGTPVVELLKFEDLQVKEWVSKWNALPFQKCSVSRGAIDRAGLAEIIHVPILLLMVAMTSDELVPISERRVRRTVLYRRFFEQIALGKLREDADGHGPIIEASKALADRLSSKELGILPEAGDATETEAQQINAMLWLMSRVAWEAHERAYRTPLTSLRIHEVEDLILGQELRLKKDVRPAIELGLVLAMQIDPAQGDKEILFGHQSFRECLVAYYWIHELRRVVKLRRKQRRHLEKGLMRVGLLQREDASLSMLRELLDAAGSDERDSIHEWAQAVANSENLSGPSLRTDRRSILRESAMAIGSHVKPIELQDPNTLRSLLAWFFLFGRHLMLDAPRLRSPKANLQGANLQGANLQGANLQGANLQGANLQYAILEGSNLQDANLQYADLQYANLQDADLQYANLQDSKLKYAKLQYANLQSTNLQSTNLQGANLRTSVLQGADLQDADLQDADLQHVDLHGAYLQGAAFRYANLQYANLQYAYLRGAALQHAIIRYADLQCAYLQHADLQHADLQHVDLQHADLQHADLQHADLQHAKYSLETQWPMGFSVNDRRLVLSSEA